MLSPPLVRPTLPPALLTMGSHSGTLAAVRSLGRAGAPVTLADHRQFVPARWSRYLTRAVRCPDMEREPERFLDWLKAFGGREPGHVLLPTCDSLAWLLAKRHRELAPIFRLYLPGPDAVLPLLNKWSLHRVCAELGIDTPATRLARDDDDLLALAREVGYPLVIKPQTQALFHPHQKGRIVRGPESLQSVYRELRASTRHASMLLASDPEVSHPLLQSFVDNTLGVHDLTGFVDETGSLFVSAGARKLLQRPRRLGVGLCFREEVTPPGLAQEVAALARRVGFRGMFDVEFVESNGRWLLIDFNPRIYGQLAFDVGRGLDLPLFEYLGAIGDREQLEAAVGRAQEAAKRPGERLFVNRTELVFFLGLLTLTGREGQAEARRFWRFYRESGSAPIPSTDDAFDWKPAIVEKVRTLRNFRNVRAALRDARER